MNKLTENEIRNFDEVAGCFKPQRVILFDSHASGEAAQGRDVDKESQNEWSTYR